MTDPKEILSFNGINASNGQYLLPPLPLERLARLTRSKARGWQQKQLFASYEARRKADMDVVDGVDKNDLAQAGWGVVFPKDPDPAVREALAPLLDWRKEQAGERYQEILVEPQEYPMSFLARHKSSPGLVEPSKIPYHLMLVGPPRQVSFDFQYTLGVDHAVGRLDLETPEDYAFYSKTVVETEKRSFKGNRRASFFGVANNGDNATLASQYYLVEPLAEDIERLAVPAGWSVDRIFREEATKSRFHKLLESPETSGSLIFTASHGVGFDRGARLQLARQGALLCADWPGPDQWPKPVPEAFYFSSDDLSSRARVQGTLFMAFACYSAGTPRMDTFYHREGERSQIASRDFTARLPQKLLARGALAFIGHIDRAWTFSFYWPQAGAQRTAFQNALTVLLQGQTVGAAMESFAARFSSLAVRMAKQNPSLNPSKPLDLLSETSLWTAYNDARSYVTLGDPAVRLSSATTQPE